MSTWSAEFNKSNHAPTQIHNNHQNSFGLPTVKCNSTIIRFNKKSSLAKIDFFSEVIIELRLLFLVVHKSSSLNTQSTFKRSLQSPYLLCCSHNLKFAVSTKSIKAQLLYHRQCIQQQFPYTCHQLPSIMKPSRHLKEAILLSRTNFPKCLWCN